MEDTKKKEEVQEVYDFKCVSCGMTEMAHYKGIAPPFSKNVQLKYPSYIMKDPFSPPGTGEVLLLGADCAICNKIVCINKQCSVFYIKTYCILCVSNAIDEFPKEITSKLNKV